MRVTYDPEVDAAYIYFQDDIPPGGAKKQVPVDSAAIGGWVVLDLDGEGRILGVEVLDARSKLPDEVLSQATRPAEGA